MKPLVITLLASGIGASNEWHEWGPWNSCDMVCGGGIRIRERTCDSDCIGISEQNESCNTSGCNRKWILILHIYRIYSKCPGRMF